MWKNSDLVNRMKHLLSSGDGADVHFLVGQETEKELLSAHKPILKIASKVFEEMFQPNSANGNVEDANWEVISSVEVTDVEVGAFKIMLNFIYTNNLSGMDENNALAVLYAAKKYHITEMIKAWKAFPIWILPDIFLAFAFTRSLGEDDFSLHCLNYIELSAECLINTKEFLKIDQSLLVELFDRDQLRVCGEIALWNAALRWADEKCRQNGQECLAENRRAMLGPALFKIRFTRIPKDEFVASIVPSGVLASDELLRVFIYHENTDCRGVIEQFSLPFATQRRNYVLKESIDFKIEKWSEFVSVDKNGKRKSSDAKFIRGIPWKINVSSYVFEKGSSYLYVNLTIDNEKQDGTKWKCFCSASLRIVSQKEGKKDFVAREGCNYGELSSENRYGIISVGHICLKKLMDSDNGWYDEENDSVTFVIEIFADEQQPQEVVK